MRILFITANRLGDAVLSTALLGHLRRQHPQARFTIVCGPVPAGLFAELPGLAALIPMEKQRFDRHWWHLWRRLRRERFDLAIDLRGSALTWVLHARTRYIFRGGRKPGPRLTHLAALLGLSPPPMPELWYAPDRAQEAARLLPPGTPLIGLCPTANVANKIWPAEHFAALFARLEKTLPNARPVIFAGPGPAERARANTLLALLPGAIDLADQHSLPLVAACLARLDLCIANDSGLMHMAAAAGAPTLGLFGPTLADEYAPQGPRAAFVCAGAPRDPRPIETLTVEAALAAVQTLLPARPAHAATQPARQAANP